jgi:hypothetical protein
VRPLRLAGAAEREWPVPQWDHRAWTLLTRLPAVAAGRFSAKLDTGVVGDAEIAGRLPRTRLSHHGWVSGRAA